LGDHEEANNSQCGKLKQLDPLEQQEQQEEMPTIQCRHSYMQFIFTPSICMGWPTQRWNVFSREMSIGKLKRETQKYRGCPCAKRTRVRQPSSAYQHAEGILKIFVNREGVKMPYCWMWRTGMGWGWRIRGWGCHWGLHR